MYLHFNLPSNTQKTKAQTVLPSASGPAAGCPHPPSPGGPPHHKDVLPEDLRRPVRRDEAEALRRGPEKRKDVRREALASGLRAAERPTRNYCHSTHHSPKTEKRQKYQVFSSLFPPKRACPKTNQELRVSYPNIKCE